MNKVVVHGKSGNKKYYFYQLQYFYSLLNIHISFCNTNVQGDK